MFVMSPENILIEQKIRDFLSPLTERYLIKSIFETCNKTLVVEITKFKNQHMVTFNLFCLNAGKMFLSIDNKEKLEFDRLDKILNRIQSQKAVKL